MKTHEVIDIQLTHAGPSPSCQEALSPFPAGCSPPAAEGIASSSKTIGRGFRRAIRVAEATLVQPVRLFQNWAALWCLRSLSKAFSDAQLILGQRMYAAGIDDGKLGARVAELDKEIQRAEAVGIPTRTLEKERESLLRLLAKCALEEDALLPGADIEFAVARELQTSLTRAERRCLPIPNRHTFW
jgi:hypothetical protein